MQLEGKINKKKSGITENNNICHNVMKMFEKMN